MAESMSNVDNFWLQLDTPTNLMEITGFMLFDKPFDMERLYTTFENRLLNFRRFRQRIVEPIAGVGTPHWELDPNFDIRSHIIRIALPAPGDKKALQDLLSDLTSAPLDRSKPMWAMYIIENVDGDGCAMFQKIHHVIADGISLIYVLLSMTDMEADAPWPEKKPEEKKKPRALADTLIKKALQTATTAATVGGIIAKEGAKAIADPHQFVNTLKFGATMGVDMSAVLLKLLLLPSDPKTTFKGKLGVRKAVAWSEHIDLKEIKAVGKAVNGTINDVLVTCMTGALRKYMIGKGDKIHNLDIKVAMPVNVRKPGTEFELGNKFSLILLALPIHLEDPILCLREVKRRMDHLKKSPDAFVGFQSLNAIGMSPSKIAKMGADFFANKTSAVFTNVPGPPIPLYFAGREIKDMMFWVPRSGDVGTGISILSYNGKVKLGLAIDEKLVSDPETILESFLAEFNNLKELSSSENFGHESLVLNDRYLEELENRTKDQDAMLSVTDTDESEAG